MKRSRGSIIQRGKGTYQIRIYLGTDEQGKRKYYSETLHVPTKTEAEVYLTKKLSELDTGYLLKPSSMTLEEYSKQWLDTKKMSITAKTYLGYKNIIDIYIIPAIGNYKLSKLTQQLIQKFYNDLLKQGLSPRTVKYVHVILKQSLKDAIINHLIASNPCDNVVLPKQTHREMRVLTLEQAKTFLDVCKFNKWGMIFELLLITGMRPSEALGLKWDDIDWVNHRINIQRTLSYIDKKWTLIEPKTNNSRRSVPIPETTLNRLKTWRKLQAKQILKAKNYRDNKLVFATKTGDPIHETWLASRPFKKLLKDAGLPNIRLYDLRHTCATLLLMSGENPKVVSERLGHASTAITLDVYSHVLPDMQEQATEKLSKMLY